MRQLQLGLAAIASAAMLVGAAPAQRWTPAWTASMWQGTNDQQRVTIENATLSFAVRVGGGGERVRLHLSNEYGAPFRIGAASIRVAGGKAQPVTFDGKRAVDVAARSVLVTDPARLKLKPFDVVQVSLFIPGRATLDTIHVASGDKTLISPPGDHTREPFAAARRTDQRPLLAAVELLSKPARPVIVAFGDSITDNTGCAMDAVPVCRWGDVLGRRLAAAGKPHVVVTQAISGNRVISRGTGPSAVERFERDVLRLPGVTHVVLLEGVNDIGGSGRVYPNGSKAPTITADQLIAGYRDLISRARQRGIKVVGLTILPYEGAGYHTPAGEAMRAQINQWILTSGEFDAVFDLARVVADPANPRRLAPALHRGDFLHPNGQGETVMGDAIPLDLFK